MRRILVPLMSLHLAACAAGGAHTLDGGQQEEEQADAETFDFPDARVRPDAKLTGGSPDAMLIDTPDASPKADAAPKADAMLPPPDAGSPDAMVQPPTGVLTDGDFAVANYDTLNVVNDCTLGAPWGNSWGINGFTYSDATNTDLAAAHFDVADGKAYVYGKEENARWGLVRFIQGDVWGSTPCGAGPWKMFTPVSVGGKQVNATIKVYRDTDMLNGTSDGWVSMAVNLWFTSPNMPKTGGDKLGKKPLVLDLMFHVECNTAVGCDATGSVEETNSYHYRKLVQQAPSKSWATLNVDITKAIDEASTTFGLGAAKSTLKLYQAEVVVYLKNAQGALSFDDFNVTVAP